jgi:hypothetical protein
MGSRATPPSGWQIRIRPASVGRRSTFGDQLAALDESPIFAKSRPTGQATPS